MVKMNNLEENIFGGLIGCAKSFLEITSFKLRSHYLQACQST